MDVDTSRFCLYLFPAGYLVIRTDGGRIVSWVLPHHTSLCTGVLHLRRWGFREENIRDGLVAHRPLKSLPRLVSRYLGDFRGSNNRCWYSDSLLTCWVNLSSSSSTDQQCGQSGFIDGLIEDKLSILNGWIEYICVFNVQSYQWC